MGQAAIFFALFSNVVGQTFLLAVLPPMGRRLGFSDIETASILSVSALVLIVAAPIWGYLSERIGRRPVLLAGLAGGALGPCAFGAVVGLRLDDAIPVAAAFGLFFAARVAQMLVTAGLLPAAQAYMADTTPPDRRAGGMGLIGAAYGLGAIGGALLAWQLADRFMLAFGLVAGLVGLAFAAMLLLLPEPARHAREAEAGRLEIGRIWPCMAITLVAFSSYSIVQQVLALQLQDVLGFSSEASIARAGRALMLAALAMVVVQTLVMRFFLGRPEHLLVVGTALGALAMLLCGWARSYGEITAVLALFGAALGCIFPGNLAIISLRSGTGAQGKAAGCNMIAQGFGLMIGPLIGAVLHQVSPQAPFAAAAAFLTLAFAIAVATVRMRARG
ncbi:MFS transporter [Enterovirga rhinocerotis]|uniref:Putative MFS family arabinose efflux permease n=1 Tax=Enterovirga rhinocerotis TaxID=1339210 RepID=A0A4R7C6B6_9HYPH|nr:MFS transporter [Enterovirga rhinocerotis]TDR93653.1 putative MFS family arabinose efflux permease [Enterovirga rhinocerotis]